MIWHNAPPQQVIEELSVNDKSGLSNGDADIRLDTYGYNIISKLDRPNFLKLFLSQLKNKMVILLIVIAMISLFISFVYNTANIYSPLLIIAIIALNALISAYQLFSCNNSLDKVKNAINPIATVLRDGIIKHINSADLVPGDIIILEEGDYISADARIIESDELRVNEVVLTDVEIPVDKDENLIFDDITPLVNRANMVYSGSNVVHGTAKAVVVATGLNTEIGMNTAILQHNGENELPFKKELQNISKSVNLAILITCTLIFFISLIINFSSQNFALMTVSSLVDAISLAVAAIPEGLPAIATIVIALGLQRILKDKITVKDAGSIELLGKTDVLCCDKTGVLTRNKMLLSRIFDGDAIIDLEKEPINDTSATILKLAAACSTLTNDSTEKAIETACLTYNSMSRLDINALFPHISSIPFDSGRKTMTVITMINEQPIAIVKGAPETVVPNCVDCDGESILKLNESLAEEGLRNICIAIRPLSTIPANPTAEEIERELTFVGLISIFDPPREGITEQIEAFNKAGIFTVMITGDNLSTAKNIARRIGILKDGTYAITGEELSRISDEELSRNIHLYSVFARVSPNDKLRIVRAWQQQKKIVTITGDSINDADALATADVGCALGKNGPDVAKGNADIIISNNHFSSIYRAVKESRGLFSNIKKSVFYLFSCNFGEILAFLFGLLIFKNAPLTAVQLLWINLLTDSAPAISLSMENADDRMMNRTSLLNEGKIFNLKSIIYVCAHAIIMAVITLVAFCLGNSFNDTVSATTMAFLTLSLSQLFHCYNNKSEFSIVSKKLFSNSFMNISIGITLFILVFLVTTPAGYVFGLNILKFKDFMICLFLAALILPLSEIIKFVSKKIDQK